MEAVASIIEDEKVILRQVADRVGELVTNSDEAGVTILDGLDDHIVGQHIRENLPDRVTDGVRVSMGEGNRGQRIAARRPPIVFQRDDDRHDTPKPLLARAFRGLMLFSPVQSFVPGHQMFSSPRYSRSNLRASARISSRS